jgi:hypothetical protein
MTSRPYPHKDRCCTVESQLTRRSGQQYLDGASAVHAPGMTPDCGRNGVSGTATSAGRAPIVEWACPQDAAAIRSGTLHCMVRRLQTQNLGAVKE